MSPVILIELGLILLFVSHRRYKSSTFAIQLLDILRQLNISTWLNNEITPDALTVRKVSGSLTNAVFFISCPSVPNTPTLLLRIYGPSSGALISRPRELRTLHALSSQYRIGPKVFGTFENGRVEEYFDSVTLTPSDLRDQRMSRLIGARMAELHSVDIAVVEDDSLTEGEVGGSETGVKKTLNSWMKPAREVLALPTFPDASRTELDINRFEEEWQRYTRWLSRTEKIEGPSRRVFSHNDAQAGNLLRLTRPKEGSAEHRQVRTRINMIILSRTHVFACRLLWWISNMRPQTLRRLI